MAISLLFVGALLAQAGAGTITVEGGADRIDVAYQELSANQNLEAIARLEGSQAVRAKDPSALINLGTAYARVGRNADAQVQYRAASFNRNAYYLQLADGTWVYSPKAARMAAEGLSKRQFLVLR